MPYAKRSELPPPVKDNLPAGAQDIFMESYNSAFADYDEKTDGPSQEVYANSVAWAAVKKSYKKDAEGNWVEKQKAVTKTVAGVDLPASAFLVVEDEAAPSTWHLQVRNERGELDHRLMGAGWAALHGGYRGNKYEGPGKQDAIAKLTKLYADEEMPLPAGGKACGDEDEEGQKAGRRLRGDKVGLLTEVKEGLEGLIRKLGELLGFVQYEDEDEDELPAVAFDTLNGWQMMKAADGQPLLVVWSTNAFEDREKEIFQTKALGDYLAWADKAGDRGTIDFWHVPGTDFAHVKEQALLGRFLVEVAAFDDTPVGRAFKAFLEQHPRGHPEIAPHGWGASPQYRYDPADRADGVYERMRKEKTSVLPAHKAANGWNPQPEVYRMDEEKKKALEAILGAEKTAELIAQGEQLTKELEARGVAFKAAAPAPQETPPETPPAAPEPEPAPAAEVKEAPAPDLATQLAPVLTAITDSLMAISTRLTVLEQKAAEKPPEPAPVAAKEADPAPAPTPFDSFAALIKASVIGSPAARLDKRTTEGKELTKGPQQVVSGADGPTPIPFINAMLAGQNVKEALGVPLSDS